MTYSTIFARSFSKHDQKKLGYGAFVGCLILASSICTVFKVDLNPLPALNLQVPQGVGLKNLLTDEMAKPHQNEEFKSIDNISEPKSIDAQTEELKQIHSILKPSTKGVQIEELNPIGHISKSSSQDLQPEKFKPIPINLEPKLTDTKLEQSIQIRNISEPKSNIQTEEFKPIPPISKQRPENVQSDQVIKPICNTSMPRSDVCEMSGDIRIDGKSSTVFLALPNNAILPEKSSWSVKPYARKEDRYAMKSVREFTVKMAKSVQENFPVCTQNHSVVGIVSSNTGFSGNHFHDFTDTIVPLYLTSREFDGEVKFLVTNKNPWWIIKYRAILQKLSKYEVIDIDKENEVHCFPNIIVGLKFHKDFNIDPSRSQHSMRGFTKFLREAYSLKRQKAINLSTQKAQIPRLLIISRRRTRSFLNEDEIIEMGRNLGYEVINAEADSNEAQFAKIVNSCDVMMGVHGAGLTNIVFLPEKAVLIQVIALGNMEWIARTAFGEPAKSMNLRLGMAVGRFIAGTRPFRILMEPV